MIEHIRNKIQAGLFEFSKHIQCSYPSRPLLKIVTLYEPNPAQWADFRVRV